MINNSKATIAVSSALAIEISRNTTLATEVAVVPMGVDKDLFRCDKEFKFDSKLLFVGRLTEKKGIKYLIQAMSEIVHKKPECTLTLVGSGEDEENLKDLTASLNLQKNVLFLGAIENKKLPSIYCDHSIFITPSLSEGFGLTIVEASMCSCLVITTDNGGIADIVENGITGLVVEQKSASDIAEKILNALENPNEMSKTVKAATKRCVQNFDWSIVKAKYVEIIKRAS